MHWKYSRTSNIYQFLIDRQLGRCKQRLLLHRGHLLMGLLYTRLHLGQTSWWWNAWCIHLLVHLLLWCRHRLGFHALGRYQVCCSLHLLAHHCLVPQEGLGSGPLMMRTSPCWIHLRFGLLRVTSHHQLGLHVLFGLSRPP
jgi:hypothetical protein